jgi:hypothetical protein
MVTATPIKLKTGDWGAKTTLKVTVGDTIRIEAKNGKSWEAKVQKIVWTDGKTSILATQSDRDSSAPSRRGGRYECEECGEYVTRGTECWETGMKH